MRYWGGILVVLSGFLGAGPLDSWHLLLAQHYAAQQQYPKAGSHYEKVVHKKDAIHYNLGNVYYHEKHYRKAIAQYMQIETPLLMHQKYHNIANALMALGEIDTAVTFYRNARKFSSHPDTLFNLKLAQTLLKKQEQEERERILRESNETLAFRDGSNKIDRFKETNGTDNLIDAKIPKNIKKRINSANAAYTGAHGKIESTLSQNRDTDQKTDSKSPDRYEAAYWENVFKKRPIKTLLIPLNTQGEPHDLHPY